MPTRIAACQDRCLQGSLRGQQSLRQVSVCERTQSVSASPRVVTLGSVWEKPYRSMGCRALCGYGYGTWMLQDDKTAFILQQKFAAREVQNEAKRSRKRKRTE